MQQMMLSMFNRLVEDRKLSPTENVEIKKRRKKSKKKKIVYHDGPVYRDTSLTQLWGNPTDASSEESSKNMLIVEDSSDEDSVESSSEKKKRSPQRSPYLPPPTTVKLLLSWRGHPATVRGPAYSHCRLGGLCIETQSIQTVNFLLTLTQTVSRHP